MNISRKNYDSEFCGSLPLHNINLIQPYGFLIVLERLSLNVLQVSENIGQLLGKTAQELVNTGFTAFLDDETSQKLAVPFSADLKSRIPLHLDLNTEAKVRNCVALVHHKPEYIILEIEESDEQQSFIEIFQEVKSSMETINNSETIEELCQCTIEELKRLSGFDKVMMYKFDENWNGTVIAEVAEEGMERYLGLTFPASDIPKQARDLYLKNPYRLIPACKYSPVKLYPVRNSLLNPFLDMSDCNLRGVPSVHLEYMENMEIAASMSTRVIVNDKLWGLISCHHKEDNNPGYQKCAMFDLLSNVVSTKITAIEMKENFEKINNLRSKRSDIIDSVYKEKSLVKGLLDHEINIMNLFVGEGAVVLKNGTIHSRGKVPQHEDIKNLVLWLQGKNISSVYAQAKLSDVYDHAADYTEVGSGILAIPIDQKKGDFAIVFRPEVVSTIHWGGNPNDAINFEADGKKYHPRNSFRLWKETVYQTSLPWQKDELDIAEGIRSFIFEYSSKYLLN